MPNTNNFESQEKFTQQLSEKMEDNLKLFEDTFCDSPPAKFISDGDVSMIAPRQSQHILNEIHHALSLNNMEEAAHRKRSMWNAYPFAIS